MEIITDLRMTITERVSLCLPKQPSRSPALILIQSESLLMPVCGWIVITRAVKNEGIFSRSCVMSVEYPPPHPEICTRSPCWDKRPNKINFRKKGFALFVGWTHHKRKTMAAGTWGGWSHCLHTQEVHTAQAIQPQGLPPVTHLSKTVSLARN